MHIVETKKGKIAGVLCGDYVEYRGIPYAKPPVGELRWKAPVETDCWEGVYQATSFTPRCAQEDFGGDQTGVNYTKEFYSNPEFERETSEDCLYLHIWAPKEVKGEKLPVAFWLHGGAFLGGFSSELEFDGKAYCERNVILVSVEYRCNIFGFLAHPWLTAENEDHISGNYGMLDQIAALKWVYENIESFGGDPQNITVFGQSAGAMSVQTLISTELTGNMIAKAIMQSGGSYGGGLHRDISLKEQEEYGMIFAEILDVQNLEEMRAKTTEELMTAMGPFFGKVFPIAKGMFLTPTMDNVLLKGGYYELMDQGKIKDIPYMLGTTKDDIMVTPEMVTNGTFSELYEGTVAFSHKLEELGRDPAYVYYFTRDLPGDKNGAFHSSELWYTFGTLDRCWRPMEEHDYELSNRMLDYWTNFMKYGNPNGEKEKEQEWRPCTKDAPVVFELK